MGGLDNVHLWPVWALQTVLGIHLWMKLTEQLLGVPWEYAMFNVVLFLFYVYGSFVCMHACRPYVFRTPGSLEELIRFPGTEITDGWGPQYRY